MFYVSNLGHKKEVLGRASATAAYGCLHCKMARKDWNMTAELGAPLHTHDMLYHGKLAEQKLGMNSNKESSTYTTFHRAHFGQTVRNAHVLITLLM